MDNAKLLNTLHDLLERERAVLLSGQFADLEKITAEKARIQGQLAPETPADLSALRVAAQRNARLLSAAQRGLDGARERLKAIQNRGADLNTYDRFGQRLCTTQSGIKLLRRA
ncbi:hypothetical protein [Actibacterium lipolyticum]|uniref:FlgN protein n=1 Tax=Actibacterium lipolyticum TaxID=1524263 RepID=A0A238KXP8_9RHOB|nr:hypothetical protein [Actibacterium lipolyticum]SMX47468.1 FlgN protein [Actibacterium lipolyticum]